MHTTVLRTRALSQIINDTLPALVKLRESGKVREAGTCKQA